MRIHRWNASTTQWDAIPSTVTILNTTFGVIKAHLDHFSYFAVLGASSSGGSPASILVIGVAGAAILIVALAVIVLKKRKPLEPITGKSKARRASTK